MLDCSTASELFRLRTQCHSRFGRNPTSGYWPLTRLLENHVHEKLDEREKHDRITLTFADNGDLAAPSPASGRHPSDLCR